MCSSEPAATGAWGRVVWAVDASGQRPALEFFEQLSEEEAAKVQVLFERLAERGRITNKTQFKKLENRKGHAIWQFKRHQIRLLGRFAGKTVPRGSRSEEEAGQAPISRS